MKSNILHFILVTSISFLSTFCYSQQIGSIDSTFNFNGINRENGNGTYATTNLSSGLIGAFKRSDNKIILSGNFDMVNGMTSRHFVRLNADGLIDTSYFNPYTFSFAIVHGILLPNDTLIAQGGISAGSLLRYDINGEIDPTFQSGNGFGGYATCSDYFPDNSILFGGSFYAYDTSDFLGNIVKINYNGVIDTSFHSGNGFNQFVSHVKVLSDGKILVAGAFTEYNFQPVNHVIRLNPDGSLDNSFNLNTIYEESVTSMEVLSNGKILIALQDLYTNITTFKRYLSNGFVDASFQTGIVSPGGAITASHSLDDGSIFISGAKKYNNVDTHGFLKLSVDGVPDNSFNQNHSCDYTITKFIPVDDSLLFIYGNFTKINNMDAINYEMIRTDGEIDYSYDQGIGASNSIFAIEPFENQYFIGGDFSYYNGKPVNRLARINHDGSLDTSFNIGSGFNNTVNDIAFQSDNKIIIVGDFTKYNGTTVNKVVRLDQNGQIDPTFNPNFNVPITLYTVATYSDTIFVGGIFYINELNGDSVRYYNIARLKMNGEIDTSFHLDNSVLLTVGYYDIQPLKDSSKLMLAGYSYSGLVRIFTNGTKDESFQLGGHAMDSVSSFTMQPDGKYLCIGNYATENSTGAYSFYRINHDGSFDPSLQTGNGLNGQLHKILYQEDGKIILLGDFTSYKNITRKRIARIHNNGDLDGSFNPAAGFNKAVYNGIIQSDKKILTVGDFYSYKNTLVNRIVRLHNTWVDIPAGTSENIISQTASINLFPNPNNGSFTLKSTTNSTIQKIEVFSLQGVKIPHTFDEQNLNIKIISTPGLYFIDASTVDNRIYRLKFEVF